MRLLRDLSATDRACLLDLAVFDWLDDDLVDEVLGTSDARVRISPEQRRSRDERAGRHDLDREILNHAPPSSPAAASGSTGTDVESTTRGIRRRPALQLLTRMSRTTERTVVVSFAAVLLLLRSSALVFGESSPFDSDQAIFGLMAKHVSEMRAFSAFGYGQSHILAVEAWLAAPLFYVFGPSVTALKLPILGINLAVVLIFLFRLERDVGLRPVMALVPTLFLIMEPLGTAVHLHQAAGGNVEPFLYVLLIWLVRRRPLLLGAILAFGFLNREFTAYGLAALLLLETLDGSLLTRRGLQDKLLAAVSAVSVFGVIDALESIGNPAGPGTTAATAAYASQMQFFLGRSCWALSGIPTWLAQMFGPHLETLYADGTPGGSRWLWLTLGATTVGALARVAVLAYPVVRKNWHRWQFPIYIALVGLAAALVPAVARCGAVIERYVLLALFLIPGIIALYLAVERNTKLRTIIVSVVLLWAAANTVDYVRYARDRYGSPPDSRQVLADYLVSNGIRFAIGDYWTAYNVTFRSGETVIMASSDFIRIRQYQDIVSRRRSDAVRVTRRPCEGGQEVAGYHVCPQGE